MYYYYNKNENAFTPYSPVPEKIIVDGVEVDNPEFLSLKTYTNAEVLEIIENANKNGKIIQPSGNTFELVDKPVPTADELRLQREPLLEAFDKWEKAVLRNREQDSVVIMGWYQDILDLIPSAFENIPERIKYYL